MVSVELGSIVIGLAVQFRTSWLFVIREDISTTRWDFMLLYPDLSLSVLHPMDVWTEA